MFILAMLAFEILNYSVTHYALVGLLGPLSLGPFTWAVILAVAFCGIDFAGITGIFSPESFRDEPRVGLLFGGWFLAATLNAWLVYRGVSMALLAHGYALIWPAVVFTAIYFAIRLLLIGGLAVLGEIALCPQCHPIVRRNDAVQHFPQPSVNSCPWCSISLTSEESTLLRCPNCQGSLHLEDV